VIGFLFIFPKKYGRYGIYEEDNVVNGCRCLGYSYSVGGKFGDLLCVGIVIDCNK